MINGSLGGNRAPIATKVVTKEGEIEEIKSTKI